MPEILLVSIVLIEGVWLFVVSLMLYRLTKHYRRLVGIDNAPLDKILDTLIKNFEGLELKLKEQAHRQIELEKQSDFHLSKVGVLRFNPFADTGGSQSFVLAFLDKSNNGLIISSHYGRENTRWYAKKVKGGRGVDFELSQEEQKAIEAAE